MNTADRCDNERTDYRADIARQWALMGPKRALDLLGVKAKTDGKGALIRCLWHNDAAPSCRVMIGQSGTLRAHCFACSESWDIFAIIAQVNRLDVRADFPEVQRLAAEMAGLWDIVDALEGKAERRPRMVPIMPSVPTVDPTPTYPPRDEVADLLAACGLCDDDTEARAWLASRGLDALKVDVRALAYALPISASLPSWARAMGKTWTASKHRMMFPLFDAAGELRSIRAGTVLPKGQIPEGEQKRLATAGYSSRGLVLACELAREVLRLGSWPDWHRGTAQVVISEGEPDWMAWATREPLRHEGGGMQQWACFGVYSGGWTAEHGARIPAGALVSVRTDLDAAGRKFAEQIIQTLAHCKVRVRTA